MATISPFGGRLTCDDLARMPEDVADDQSSILTDANVHGVPAIVAEVLSEETRQRDTVDKQQLYDRAGVRE